jgi:ferrous iron transport protein B
VQAARKRVESAGIDWRSAAIESRYDRAAEIYREVVTETRREGESLSDRLDRVLTHKFWGMVIFVALMVVMFQSIFTFAQVPMDLIKDVVSRLADGVNLVLEPGDLNSLISNGVVQGVGAVVVFLPQICLLFLFISILEDTGYMARAAFLMDRLMSRVGLHGKSFIPMLSSFACAIPGIMATRTIESPKDRLVTILVAPLMSCSARLPVYTLLIAACIPNIRVLGILTLPGLTMLAMYLLGIIVALLMAWIFKKTLLKAETPLLIMELPPYKRPLARVVLRHMWDRSKLFLRRAGTVILGINILLWFLATYPRDSRTAAAFSERRAQLVEQFAGTQSSPEKTAEIIRKHRQMDASKAAVTDTNHIALINGLNTLDHEEAGANLRNSFAGRMAHVIAPLIAPLGFDWKMGIGIVASFAAREVFVSTMSVVYNVGESADSESSGLVETIRDQRREDGALAYTPLVGVTLMVFYVFAMQCVSTVAVVRRETNSWKWPVFQWLYMGALAWVFAFVTYHGGHLLGFR